MKVDIQFFRLSDGMTSAGQAGFIWPLIFGLLFIFIKLQILEDFIYFSTPILHISDESHVSKNK